ncbi:MAG: alkaline phosphatase family protein [Bacteroidetes bacterium]|nr:alkaline phosphatase family protein [Bacteroidota bacterium]
MHLIDERVIAAADSGIRNQAPDLTWVYLEYTDDMGHRYGDSPKMTDAVEKLDKQLGKLYDAIQYREAKYKEKWLLIITTDHGRDEKNGKNHGGQSPRQRSTWIVSNKKLNNYAHLDYPAIVDIMPTFGNFMGMNLPNEVTREIDGISLIGKVSVAQPEINVFQQKLDLRWQSLDTSGTVKICISTKNEFKTGAQDQYIFLQEVPIQKNRAIIDISQYPSDFYKIVMEGKYNTINRWFVKNAK